MPADAPGPDAPAVTVVLPAHDEEELLATTVGELVEGLTERGIAHEVLVVENGSTDATAAEAERLAAEVPGVVVLRHPEADYGQALRAGLRAARGATIVTFDVDYYDLGFFDQGVAELEQGAGIVVGTKRGPGSQDDRPWPRRLVTGAFALVLRVGFGLRASDTHGMKVHDRAQVLPLEAACRLGADLFDTELVLRAERTGVRVAEVPVRVVERRPARSPITRRILRSLVGLWRLRRALGVR